MIQISSNKSIFKKDILTKIIPASIIIAVLLFSRFVNPENSIIPQCLFHSFTGYSCPTCGLSRSLYSIANFHVFESFKHHLMGPVIASLMLLYLIRLSCEAVTGKEISIKGGSKIIKIFLGILFSIWIFYWIIKLTGEF